MYNFTISAIPAGLRFFRADCVALDVFGDVSLGITRDALRLGGMPSLTVEAPRFVQSVDDAAEYFAGLLRAEVSPERLASLREFFAGCPDEFAPHEITLPGDRWIGEKAFGLAFQYASGGRALIDGESQADDAFAAAMWEVFAEAFFAAETAAA